MIRPPRWSEEELERDGIIATAEFRRQRIREPLEYYLEALDESRAEVEDLLEATVDLTRLREEAQHILEDGRLLTAFRYLAGPPISQDELQILVDSRISSARLRNDPELAPSVAQVVLDGIDRRRFPWISEEREPDEHEIQAAALATAALMAMRKTGTMRRHSGKNEQEAAVAAALSAAGFIQVARRDVKVLNDAPGPGEFCGESMLGNRKADFLVGLYDRRTMAIECKVSNSSVNSIKRLNNDAAAKAEAWSRDFGTVQVIPSAVLSGVYNLHHLIDAQRRGLTVYWAHDLAAMIRWIERTRR